MGSLKSKECYKIIVSFRGVDHIWNEKTINDEVGTYLHNKQKQCGVRHKICPGARCNATSFFELSRELLH